MPAFRLSLTVCARHRRNRQRRGHARRSSPAASGSNRLGVSEAGGAQHGDEDLHRDDLAGIGVDHLGGAAGEIDEQALAGDMDLTHRRLQPTGPGPVEIAEPGIAEAVGGAGAVLLPQQRQRHIGTASSRCTQPQSGIGR